jgi:hypothetical protein
VKGFIFRFTASVANVGNADFLPFIPKTAWEWHACHQHYHSMEVKMFFEQLVNFIIIIKRSLPTHNHSIKEFEARKKGLY